MSDVHRIRRMHTNANASRFERLYLLKTTEVNEHTDKIERDKNDRISPKVL